MLILRTTCSHGKQEFNVLFFFFFFFQALVVNSLWVNKWQSLGSLCQWGNHLNRPERFRPSSLFWLFRHAPRPQSQLESSELSNIRSWSFSHTRHFYARLEHTIYPMRRKQNKLLQSVEFSQLIPVRFSLKGYWLHIPDDKDINKRRKGIKNSKWNCVQPP